MAGRGLRLPPGAPRRGPPATRSPAPSPAPDPGALVRAGAGEAGAGSPQSLPAASVRESVLGLEARSVPPAGAVRVWVFLNTGSGPRLPASGTVSPDSVTGRVARTPLVPSRDLCSSAWGSVFAFPRPHGTEGWHLGRRLPVQQVRLGLATPCSERSPDRCATSSTIQVMSQGPE